MHRPAQVRFAASTARRTLTLLALLLITGGLSAAGIYQAAGVLGGARASVAARPGEAIAVPGGLLRVDRVAPEHMAAMHAGQFASAGMSMPPSTMDMAPEGYRRFSVDISFAGQSGAGVRYAAEQFQLTGAGMAATGALRYSLGGGVVPAGSVASGNLVFQVPNQASNFLLHFGGSTRPIALYPEPSEPAHSRNDSQEQHH
jgi:hypothetical protein